MSGSNLFAPDDRHFLHLLILSGLLRRHGNVRRLNHSFLWLVLLVMLIQEFGAVLQPTSSMLHALLDEQNVLLFQLLLSLYRTLLLLHLFDLPLTYRLLLEILDKLRS